MAGVVIAMTLTNRATAIFASPLQPSESPGQPEITAAIRVSLLTHGGAAGCAAIVAAEYGEHPDTAVPRMRWALRLAAADRLVAAA